MKRILFLTTALTLFAFSSYAQLFTFGPKIGLSSSKVRVMEDVEGIASGDSEVGFHAGLFARVSVLGFYVQPEAMFTSAKGNIVLDESVTNNAESIQELSYNKLDVPVMLGFKIGPLLRVNAGPTFSFILDQDIRSEGAAAVEDVSQNYNDANVGYQVGVGLDISKIVIDLKYENNLNALGESVTIGGQEFETDMRNQLIQLSLGYQLF
ncbi:porin family protein [Porifericola rhodea]|uniref:porin family protein n=1 Tax=Porifericola rhodea TaxID=930972 RepID=UPI002666A91E|nr:porin family protein [Porifericola rhodea]WKN31305.1 porin family protein [Porifericola rhodea]